MSNEKASIVCFEQFIEAFLTESSKSSASIANIRLTMNNGYCLQKTVKYTYAMQHITKNSIDGLDETDNDYIYYYSVKFVN